MSLHQSHHQGVRTRLLSQPGVGFLGSKWDKESTYKYNYFIPFSKLFIYLSKASIASVTLLVAISFVTYSFTISKACLPVINILNICSPFQPQHAYNTPRLTAPHPTCRNKTDHASLKLTTPASTYPSATSPTSPRLP